MEERMVDALEDGKIVRVSERYARSEGLMILRRPLELEFSKPEEARETLIRKENMPPGRRREKLDLERYRKPLHNPDLVKDLKDNFHWDLINERKKRNMSRRQLAMSLNVGEDDIKSIENGILPSKDYILLNKLEAFFSISLRKDGTNFQQSATKAALDSKPTESDIEVFD